MSMESSARTSMASARQPLPVAVPAPAPTSVAVSVGRPTPLWQRLAAAVGLLLLSPVALAVAVAIKLASRGPVLYSGQRVGRGGKTFTIFKFRTLEVGAERKIGARLLGPEEKLYTRVGRFLKRAKLDEIPQLLNVVRGEMNLVGPRPVRPVFLDSFCREIPGYMLRLTVNPGMTGLAQLRGGYFTHPRDKLRYDRLYIRNRSWWLDFRLVTLTFIKVLNRWLTLGVLLTLLFVSAALLPGLFHYPFQLELVGFRLSPFELAVAATAAWLIVQRAPRHELRVYQTPVNQPMAVFVGFALLAALVSPAPGEALQGVAYYVATGFFLTFLIVNSRLTAREANLVAAVVGLSAVSVCLVGLLQIGLDNQFGQQGAPRMSSTLGNPVLLATYIVLGLPFLLIQMLQSCRREQRDFWVACSTVALIGVFLTQTRMGLLALVVTMGTFLWQTRYRYLGILALVFAMLFSIFVAGHRLRLSLPEVAAEMTRRSEVVSQVLSAPPRELLLGVGSTQRRAISPIGDGDGTWISTNMHLTLIRQHGLVGWMLMLWIFAAALVGLYGGFKRIHDRHMRRIVWAIFSSMIGFVISMTDANVFFNVTIQVFFWGMVGIGMSIVTHLNGRRPTFRVLWRFGEHGD